jgi:hypothetical protein
LGVAGVLQQDHLRVGQAAGQFAGDLGGRVAVVVAGADQRARAQRAQDRAVVRALGPAAQRGGGAKRIGRQHHAGDLRGERVAGMRAEQPRAHDLRDRAHPLFLGDAGHIQPGGRVLR